MAETAERSAEQRYGDAAAEQLTIVHVTQDHTIEIFIGGGEASKVACVCTSRAAASPYFFEE